MAQKKAFYFCCNSTLFGNPKIAASSSCSQALVFLVNNLFHCRNPAKLFKPLKWLPEPLPLRTAAGRASVLANRTAFSLLSGDLF